MQVTAAHEYFHAVQFAYDFFEDGWFMEATATWAEDELYDSVNDNVNYLDRGQIGTELAGSFAGPRHALDGFFGLQRLRQLDLLPLPHRADDLEQAGMPVLVRDIWRLADATAGQRTSTP